MASTADAVIIGGGVMGCSILYNLAERGVTNTLLLERDVLASGSTSRSQAILRMHYSNEVTTRLAWDSLAIFKEFHEIIGVPSGYTKTGYFIIVGPEDRRAMEGNVSMQRSVGVDTSVVTAEGRAGDRADGGARRGRGVRVRAGVGIRGPLLGNDRVRQHGP